MTLTQQKLWDKAARLSMKDTFKINEGKFDDLFYRVAIDYYTKMLMEQVKKPCKC